MITMKYKMSKGIKIMITAFISVYLGNLILDILSADSHINIWLARIIGLFVVLIIYLLTLSQVFRVTNVEF
ncbi:hypothetical protein [Lactococcus cremoris]|uniref:Putative secreted protein n=2 Tax=Lactococcus lactis subsp. cremoris TaxID=1359 RepID=A2RJ28_LACLM|nr:hypothetical protein [Lactococcus cremoris]CAL97278.1 putative secreted protein [Lactococcus cremoris subsp. cremoris MG1363]